MATYPKRVVFMGTPEFAVPSLRALLRMTSLVSVVGVVTQPDRPKGRGRKLSPSPVKQAAVEMGIPVSEATKFRSEAFFTALSQWAPELMVIAAFGRILPARMLKLPPLGCVNVHASLLPRHRGASPIAHAIWAGDCETGVCLMQMDEGLDTGAVYARAARPIAQADTCGSLTLALSELGAGLLETHLAEIITGQLAAVPQPSEGVTHAPPLSKQNGELDFQRSATELARQIRALDPWPQTYTFAKAERLGVLAAEAAPDDESLKGAAPGSLIMDRKGPKVVCKQGLLRLLQVKPEGRGAMDAGAWLRGKNPKPDALGGQPQTVPAGK